MERDDYKNINLKYIIDFINKNLKLVITLAFGIFLSCSNTEKIDGLNVFLWNLEESSSNSKVTEIFIEKGKLYKSNFGKLVFRKLNVNEMDSLSFIISQMDLKKIDNKYYKNLARYDYMFDLSINYDGKSVSTYLYDSIVSPDIKQLYNYLLIISEKNNRGRYLNT